MRTFIVTGANRGIGLEICRQLKRRGDRVIACCRHRSKELEKLNVQIEEDVDISSAKSVEDIASKLKNEKIDILINNAGIFRDDHIQHLDYDDIFEQFKVNAVGALRMSMAFLNNLQDGGKIALISSYMGSIAENSYGTTYGYRMSKAALNMAGVSLSHDLKSKGVAVGIFHPGYVRTDMTSYNGAIDPPESARGLITLIDGLNLTNSGTFWHTNGTQLPW